VYKTLEHNEHASHVAHGYGEEHDHHPPTVADEHTKGRLFSAQLAALLIAGLAAGLALSEQGAKHAEIKVQANLVDAADAWAQYQAKSTRSTISKDLTLLIGVMEPVSTPGVAERRKQVLAQLEADQERFDNDPRDGRTAIAARARGFEEARDFALEQTHAYHNGSALMELGIVLSTASAILGSRKLLGLGGAVGVVGVFCALLGYWAPSWGAF
jgi:Domain of unknown function (DUF4337)